MEKLVEHTVDSFGIKRVCLKEPTKRSVCDGCKDNCDRCSFKLAIERLAAYEDTGLTPEQIQEAVDLLNDSLYEADVPQELLSWVERCTWHVRKCNELRIELEKYQALGSIEELIEMKSRLEGLEK